MRVLLTGIDGYIGSLLAPILESNGHEVVGLDTGLYRDGWLYSQPSFFRNTSRTINKDIRNIDEQDVAGYDVVIHLAELSNDPLGENKPDVTFDINHHGSVRLAEMCKKAGVGRFVYTSSCSVYGVSDADFVDETSPVDPQTAYAKCKVLVEQDVGALASDHFSPVFLRNATAYGASPRMRFDIVLNNLAGLAWTAKNIAMTSDGSPWRPLVHVLDICEAIRATLESPTDRTHNQIFNVGAKNANFQVREIAEIVASQFPGCDTTFGEPGGDNRSYRVNFDKIHDSLATYKPVWNPESGAKQLFELFSMINMSDERFGFRAFTRLKQLNYLIQTNQIDNDFYWAQSFAG